MSIIIFVLVSIVSVRCFILEREPGGTRRSGTAGYFLSAPCGSTGRQRGTAGAAECLRTKRPVSLRPSEGAGLTPPDPEWDA